MNPTRNPKVGAKRFVGKKRITHTAKSAANISTNMSASGDSPIYLRGEDAAEAYRSWAKEEISSLSSTRYDIGKFFFTVSSAAIAAACGLQRSLEAHVAIPLFITSMAFFGCALLWSIKIVIPHFDVASGSEDLVHQHKILFHKCRVECYVWFVLFIAGLICFCFDISK